MTDDLPSSLYLHCESCGDLEWTIGVLGHVAHKHECPHRTDSYCQTHPHGCPSRSLPLAPLFAVFVALMAVGGAALAQHLPSTRELGAAVTKTSVGTAYRTVTKVTKGRVITLPGGTQVVHVPAVVIHAKGRRIIVPAHNLKIHRIDRLGGLLNATVAEPLVPVTVTVYVPSEPVTVTTTETSPAETAFSTTTVTVPLATTEDTP
jgi:hypothetical protein